MVDTISSVIVLFWSYLILESDTDFIFSFSFYGLISVLIILDSDSNSAKSQCHLQFNI